MQATSKCEVKQAGLHWTARQTLLGSGEVFGWGKWAAGSCKWTAGQAASGSNWRRGGADGGEGRSTAAQQQHSSDESSSTAAQQSGGGPLGSWLSPGSSLALGPLGVVVAGSADGTGRREESRLGWDG